MPTALLSVSDKTNLTGLAQALREAGFDLVSTGGTFAHLQAAGIEVSAVEDLTGMPEILDGRVKTLHPAVHAGILARDLPDHQEQLRQHGFKAIDVVVANLYPFRATIADPQHRREDAIEQIDIGGPTLIRAAAKNHERVWVVVDPADYSALIAAIGEGDAGLRAKLAAKAFRHVANYDAAIAGYLEGDAGGGLPGSMGVQLELAQELRYGENPHLRAGRYRRFGERGMWDDARQHKGSRLSYLNIVDGEAAWRLVHEFGEPACVIVKHANACGVAVAGSADEAYERAFLADPQSAFGGVVAFNREVTAGVAESLMANPKIDLLLAPAFTGEALEVLGRRRKAMRVVQLPGPGSGGYGLREIEGGFLLQEVRPLEEGREAWRTVTEREPTAEQLQDAWFAWVVCAHTMSNAIVLARDGVTAGIGAGQQSRVDAARIAREKAAGRAAGGVAASDAFFPFRDGLEAVVEAGVAVVVQPGGSVRDGELVAAANELGIAMIFTGQRQFRH